MNENNAQKDQASEQGQEGSERGSGSSTPKVLGDGTATLARLEERQTRLQRKADSCALEVEEQKVKVNERRRRANEKAAAQLSARQNIHGTEANQSVAP